MFLLAVAGHLTDGHLADRHFTERTFHRTDISVGEMSIRWNVLQPGSRSPFSIKRSEWYQMSLMISGISTVIWPQLYFIFALLLTTWQWQECGSACYKGLLMDLKYWHAAKHCTLAWIIHYFSYVIIFLYYVFFFLHVKKIFIIRKRIKTKQ